MIKKRIMLKEEYVEITGSILAALVLEAVVVMCSHTPDFKAIEATDEDIAKFAMTPLVETKKCLSLLSRMGLIGKGKSNVRPNISNIEKKVGSLTVDRLGSAILPNVPIAPSTEIIRIGGNGRRGYVHDKKMLDAMCKAFSNVSGVSIPRNRTVLATDWYSFMDAWLAIHLTEVATAKQMKEAVRNSKESNLTVARPKSIDYFMVKKAKKSKGMSAR